MQVNNIVVVGCGGTGSYLLQPLARILSAAPFFNNLMLIDGDIYAEDNVFRQEFPSVLVGTNKAEAQAMVLSKKFKILSSKVLYSKIFLDDNTVNDYFTENDIVFICVDNHAARKVICERAETLKNCLVICAGNEMTSGQVQYYWRHNGQDLSPNIFDAYPEIKATTEVHRSELSCEQIANLPGGGQTVAANFMAAALMLSYYQSFMSFQKTKFIPCNRIEYDVKHVNFVRHGEQELVLNPVGV